MEELKTYIAWGVIALVSLAILLALVWIIWQMIKNEDFTEIRTGCLIAIIFVLFVTLLFWAIDTVK